MDNVSIIWSRQQEGGYFLLCIIMVRLQVRAHCGPPHPHPNTCLFYMFYMFPCFLPSHQPVTISSLVTATTKCRYLVNNHCGGNIISFLLSVSHLKEPKCSRSADHIPHVVIAHKPLGSQCPPLLLHVILVSPLSGDRYIII